MWRMIYKVLDQRKYDRILSLRLHLEQMVHFGRHQLSPPMDTGRNNLYLKLQLFTVLPADAVEEIG